MEAKVRTASDQVIDLVPTTSQQATNTFSLTNLAAGVYTLDVIMVSTMILILKKDSSD